MKTEVMRKFNPEDNQLLGVVGDVQEGLVDPLIAYLYLHKVKKAAEEALARVERLADLVSLREQYPKGELIDGLQVAVQSTPTTYKYSYAVTTLEESLKRRKELEKQACKMQASGQMLIDEATGEVIPPATAVLGQQKLYISKPK